LLSCAGQTCGFARITATARRSGSPPSVAASNPAARRADNPAPSAQLSGTDPEPPYHPASDRRRPSRYGGKARWSNRSAGAGTRASVGIRSKLRRRIVVGIAVAHQAAPCRNSRLTEAAATRPTSTLPTRRPRRCCRERAQRYPIVSGPVGGSSMGVVPGCVGGSGAGGKSGVSGTTGPLSGGSSTGRCPGRVGGSWAGCGCGPG
jgi:hypothetical protein